MNPRADIVSMLRSPCTSPAPSHGGPEAGAPSPGTESPRDAPVAEDAPSIPGHDPGEPAAPAPGAGGVSVRTGFPGGGGGVSGGTAGGCSLGLGGGVTGAGAGGGGDGSAPGAGGSPRGRAAGGDGGGAAGGGAVAVGGAAARSLMGRMLGSGTSMLERQAEWVKARSRKVGRGRTAQPALPVERFPLAARLVGSARPDPPLVPETSRLSARPRRSSRGDRAPVELPSGCRFGTRERPRESVGGASPKHPRFPLARRKPSEASGRTSGSRARHTVANGFALDGAAARSEGPRETATLAGGEASLTPGVDGRFNALRCHPGETARSGVAGTQGLSLSPSSKS